MPERVEQKDAAFWPVVGVNVAIAVVVFAALGVLAWYYTSRSGPGVSPAMSAPPERFTSELQPGTGRNKRETQQ